LSPIVTFSAHDEKKVKINEKISNLIFMFKIYQLLKQHLKVLFHVLYLI